MTGNSRRGAAATSAMHGGRRGGTRDRVRASASIRKLDRRRTKRDAVRGIGQLLNVQPSPPDVLDDQWSTDTPRTASPRSM